MFSKRRLFKGWSKEPLCGMLNHGFEVAKLSEKVDPLLKKFYCKVEK